MRLEREIKEVYEPIRIGGWEIRLNVPQDIENWTQHYADLTNMAYVEVVRYV